MNPITKNKINELPPELSEISGITFLSDTVLVAIQDEEGILYYYNIPQNRIIKKQTFAGSGDYEDLIRKDYGETRATTHRSYLWCRSAD